MDYIEKTADTVEEAIDLGLAELGQTRDRVEIEILEESSKGFLGLGRKPARVRMRKNFDPKKIVRDFLKELTISMNVLAEITIWEVGKNLNVELKGENMGVLIGKRGQTLDSIQHLTNLVVNKGTLPYVNVIVDVENYRDRRRRNLEILALNMARKVRTTKMSVSLEPMSSGERKIIHSILEKDRYIYTRSTGKEPYRYIQIEPKIVNREMH